MIDKDIRATKKGFSAYHENPQPKENPNFAKFKKEQADFCIYDCPHPKKSCKGKCKEYFDFVKTLKEKYEIV